MEVFIILVTIFISVLATFTLTIMFWYNGVLDVNMEEDGDNLKLNINEYDLIRKRRFMIILIKRNK